ncbi:MAG: membrane protein insertase YidC [Deltaproteobacteria bacterium]|nr:MAG: membrane protein insertase YidC [Deltaproteobacteria bacterium]
MEQRRLLLAFGLSVLILFLYQELIVRRYRGAPTETPAVSTAERAPAPASTPDRPPSTTALAAPADGADLIPVETGVIRAAITPLGARLNNLELKSYRRTVDPDSEPLELVAPGPILPLTLQLGGEASDARLVYHADLSALQLAAGEQGEIVFQTDSPSGLRIEKRYRFEGDGYLFHVTVRISGDDVPRSLGLILTPMPLDGLTGAGREVAIALVNQSLKEKPLADVHKQPFQLEPSVWVGFAAQYFLSAAIPLDGPAPAVATAVEDVPFARLDTPLVDGAAQFAIYAGPKDREVLARAGQHLDRALDFGLFWFVAIPLLHALRALDRVTRNYGVAIIVLTTLVKVATIPLTRTTFRNMREMQKIQPQMAKLRERHKDDQVALQKEMMELYRRHRLNPLTGCLPMVLQLPIFVGLYNTLSHAIELRHAPFALWIRDLSAPDRLMIGGVGVPVLTLLMGASMFLQQWLTPQQGDPTQQRMMMIMPLVFTFMFINFPAGLVLYWLVNNLLTIGQQYAMMRSS